MLCQTKRFPFVLVAGQQTLLDRLVLMVCLGDAELDFASADGVDVACHFES